MVRSTAMIRPGTPLRSRSSSAASTDRYPLLRRRRNRLRTNSAATSGNRGPRALPASAPDRAAAAPGFRPAKITRPRHARYGRRRGRYSATPDRASRARSAPPPPPLSPSMRDLSGLRPERSPPPPETSCGSAQSGCARRRGRPRQTARMGRDLGRPTPGQVDIGGNHAGER